MHAHIHFSVVFQRVKRLRQYKRASTKTFGGASHQKKSGLRFSSCLFLFSVCSGFNTIETSVQAITAIRGELM